MQKTLKTVQKFFEVFKILATIVTVLLFVGGGISLVTGVIFLVLPADIVEYIQENARLVGGASINDLKFDEIGIICLISAFKLLATAVTGVFVTNYFKHELKDGTPFTLRGSKELLTLSIIVMAVPFGVAIISQILASLFNCSKDLIDVSIPVVTGVVMIGLSYVFKYGSEVIESLPKSNTVTEDTEK